MSEQYYEQWQKIPTEAVNWQKSTFQKYHPARQKIANYVKRTSKSILDVGCGICEDYKYYKNSKIQYLGVDVTARFLEIAKQNGASVRQASVLNLPFEDNSFDTVYFKDLLIHLQPEQWKTALKEMARVAKLQVVTLEDEWQQQTEYTQDVEKHVVLHPENSSVEFLFFYSNFYGKEEVLDFAEFLGLMVKVLGKGLNVERSRNTQRKVNWQITVYKKP